MPLFDRTTGDIEPAVSAYWSSHYDNARRIDKSWKVLAPDLQGKIHLWVGTDDTFYLDGAAHGLQDTLRRHAIRSQFTFLPGLSHFNVYADGDDRYALFDEIAAQMYHVTRPNSRAIDPKIPNRERQTGLRDRSAVEMSDPRMIENFSELIGCQAPFASVGDTQGLT